jgi:hypothetical protein
MKFRLLLSTTVFAVGLLGQPQYVSRVDNDLTTTARSVTVQQSAASATMVKLIWAKVYCEEACVVTTSRNGTAATATSATPVKLHAGVADANAVGYTQSDVGAGTTLDTDAIPATNTMYFDLSAHGPLDGNTTSSNLTLKTDAITGRVIISIYFREDGRGQ